MPRVFKGKIVIPGDKLEEFFKIIKRAENARAPFRKYLESLSDDFCDYLFKKFKPPTVNKHEWIVQMFVDFICNYTDVEKIEEITRGMVNTEFHQWYNRKVIGSKSRDDLCVSLKKFFAFLAKGQYLRELMIYLPLIYTII